MKRPHMHGNHTSLLIGGVLGAAIGHASVGLDWSLLHAEVAIVGSWAIGIVISELRARVRP